MSMSLNIKKVTLLELQITQTRHYQSILDGQKSKFNTPKNEKISIECAKVEGVHLQFVNNYYPEFEYKGMKTFGVTDYTN